MTVVNIAEHIPTEAQLAKKEADRERQQRNRAHKGGGHSHCLPRGTCPVANGESPAVTRDVTPTVTRDVGTGQDRTGQDGPGLERGSLLNVTRLSLDRATAPVVVRGGGGPR